MPDPTRRITKLFAPGGDLSESQRSRLEHVLSRILALSDSEVTATLGKTRERFAGRHADLQLTFETSFAAVARFVTPADKLSAERRLLIGAYFTHEYSIESAAISNPSIVLAPDQDGLAPGEQRFVLSLRAIGEGHISSIEFRSGVITAAGHVTLETPSPLAYVARQRASVFEKSLFRRKLTELSAHDEIAVAVLAPLPEAFTMAQLEASIRDIDRKHDSEPAARQATRTLHWLASSNYETTFSPDSRLSERVIFPAAPNESHGMEDARFVRFVRDDGAATYFATYTAYDGQRVLPQLIETADFVTFRIATLNGACATNKGIALFPRMIGGRYVALSRMDNENNFLMRSDNVHFWQECEVIQRPERPWEITQLGNCGSPLETEAGWLVITHGVGPMRQYALGAILLDLEDPSRVIGHLAEPLLEPAEDEREGYVPNVVYSCGSMIAGELLVLPFGFADIGTRIATVRLADLLASLTAVRRPPRRTPRPRA